MFIDDNNVQEAEVLPFAAGELRRITRCPAGEMLRAARLASQLSVEAVVKLTRIRHCYIEALETGQLGEFVAPIYAIGFARNYARAVGLDPERIEREMRAYIAQAQTSWRRSGWLS